MVAPHSLAGSPHGSRYSSHGPRGLCRARWLAFGFSVATLGLAGCAGHEARVEAALGALDRGRPAEAVSHLNHELGVESAQDLPRLEGDAALLVLDRGTILQAMGDHELSRRDLGAADKAIDLLDMSRSGADELGRYLFSDDVGPYRAPAYEKLLVNAVNLVNYLCLRDLEGARVEARRLAVVQNFLESQNEPTSLTAFGSTLAGFAFEKSGRPDDALNHYDDALKVAQYRTLAEPVARLTGERPPRSPRVEAAIAGAPAALDPNTHDLFVVVGYGRVPRRIPKRIPIGLALTMTAGYMSPHDRARANTLAAKGLVTWVNYPALEPVAHRGHGAALFVDGRPVRLELLMDVDAEVRKAYAAQEGTIVLSAITRLIARAAAGEIIGAGSRGGSRSGVVGLIAGLATTATLAAADTPDTRSWSTLPARVAVARLRLPAGRHTIDVQASGRARRTVVDAKPGEWSFVSLSELR